VSHWPSTINAAAERVLSELTPTEKASLAVATDEDLFSQHFGLCMQIRNDFGLWSGNTQLLDDCTRWQHLQDGQPESEVDEMMLFLGRMDADGASNTILLAARDQARLLQDAERRP
jgi:hypothetical protein